MQRKLVNYFKFLLYCGFLEYTYYQEEMEQTAQKLKRVYSC